MSHTAAFGELLSEVIDHCAVLAQAKGHGTICNASDRTVASTTSSGCTTYHGRLGLVCVCKAGTSDPSQRKYIATGERLPLHPNCAPFFCRGLALEGSPGRCSGFYFAPGMCATMDSSSSSTRSRNFSIFALQKI